MKKNLSSNLPLLAFGDFAAPIQDAPHVVAATLREAFPHLLALRARSRSGAFLGRCSTLGLPSLRMVTLSATPVTLRLSAGPRILLAVPLAGEGEVRLRGRWLDYGAGHAAVCLPRGEACLYAGTGSVLLLALAPAPLHTAAGLMLEAGGRGLPEVTVPRLLPFQPALLYSSGLLGRLCQVIDSCHGDARLLALTGIEQMFFRLAVLMLWPRLFRESLEPLARTAPQAGGDLLQSVCSFARSRLGERLSLSELARVGGVSGRALQYAFRARFGCSPMYWLREQRLLEARRALLEQPDRLITDVAQDYGFGSSSQFSSHYRARFGCTPQDSRKSPPPPSQGRVKS